MTASLSSFQFVYLLVFTPTCLHVCLYTHLWSCMSVWSIDYSPVCLISSDMSVCPFAYSLVYMSVCLLDCLHVNVATYSRVYICQRACAPVCLSACLHLCAFSPVCANICKKLRDYRGIFFFIYTALMKKLKDAKLVFKKEILVKNG